MPDDLREESEEGESEGTKGGMGLGEGDGEKDVSDQIESLDQLEDAKRPEDYKNQKEEHKDCKVTIRLIQCVSYMKCDFSTF